MRVQHITTLSFVGMLAACDFTPDRTIELSPPNGTDGGIVFSRDAGRMIAGADSGVTIEVPSPDGGVVDASPPRDGGAAPVGIDAGSEPPFTSNYDPSEVAISGAIRIDCDARIDTDAPAIEAWCGAPPAIGVASNDFALIGASRFEVTPNGRLDIRGSRPLVLVVTGNVLVDGVITSAHATRECPRTDGRDEGAGGGGGGFATDGAPGGSGPEGEGGEGGGALGTPELVPLDVGCRGGDGADRGGDGGRAGGAFEISSSGAILVRGRIEAFGEGGRGGARREAGGGGGAGGAILLEGDVVTLDGGLFANGGGGGQAGGENDGRGEDGADGAPDSMPAPGGSSGAGASGGDGAARDVEPQPGTDGQSGGGGSGGDRPGGGGGGAAGRIRINANRCALTGEASPEVSRGGGC